jgi:hypothetical protein
VILVPLGFATGSQGRGRGSERAGESSAEGSSVEFFFIIFGIKKRERACKKLYGERGIARETCILDVAGSHEISHTYGVSSERCSRRRERRNNVSQDCEFLRLRLFQ